MMGEMIRMMSARRTIKCRGWREGRRVDFFYVSCSIASKRGRRGKEGGREGGGCGL